MTTYKNASPCKKLTFRKSTFGILKVTTYATTCALACGFLSFSSFFSNNPLSALTISEKKALLSGQKSQDANAQEEMRTLNADLEAKRAELLQLCQSTNDLYQKAIKENANGEYALSQLKVQIDEIEKKRAEIKILETSWKSLSKSLSDTEDEGLWHQPDTTIGQLIIDYGAHDFVYLMPPEIANLKVHVSSQLTVPRSAWNEMVELILASYGVGIKQLNSFTRQLFFMRLNQSSPSAILDKKEELLVMPYEARVCYIITPPPTETRRVFHFLEKFVPQEQMTFQMIGNNIVMVGLVKEVLELNKLYEFASSPKQQNDYKLITLQKAHSEEIAKILQSLFDGDSSRGFGDSGDAKHPSFFPQDTSSGFRVITLKYPAQSLFLLGKREQIEKATQIIQDIESRINEAQEKTVYWYSCKHSDAEELAKVLSQVYTKMVSSPQAFGAQKGRDLTRRLQEAKQNIAPKANLTNPIDDSGYAPPLVVGREMIEPSEFSKKRAVDINDNFIVDTKTNSVVMVVEAALLDKLKELLKELDVAKKMVQIDVLLVEKRTGDSNSFGMNLLKIGSAASHKHKNSLVWNDSGRGRINREEGRHRHGSRRRRDEGDHDLAPLTKGILNFSISRISPSGLPAYDLALNFLLTQENVQINSNPSVTTINQTPAKIAIVEEISLNTGVVEIDSTKTAHLKDSYTRVQYGTTIQITPTIHAKSERAESGNERKFVTLATEIKFDTQDGRSGESRPNITTRYVKNEVRIADGETVILGGLKRKTSADEQETIPFLGELPGIGKLFSNTNLTDHSTEMFIFITPRIISDLGDEYHQMRLKELTKRPGDLPEFLEEVELAKRENKKMLFERSLRALFGQADAFNLGYRTQ